MGEYADFTNGGPVWPVGRIRPTWRNGYNCKYCNASGLYWKQQDGKWRLHDRKSPHVCESYVNKENKKDNNK